MTIIRSPHLSHRSQQGAALIVVLLFLILIVLAGAIAVKQSTTDLKLATGDQINTILQQSADNAVQNIEQSINGSSNTQIYKDMMSRSGPFGHFILDPDSLDHEYVFCFRPREQFLDINRTSIITDDGSTVLSGGRGYCNPSRSADYASARNTSMTQVNVRETPNDPANEPFGNYTIGQDSNEIASRAHTFDVTSTSVLPAYADTKIDGTNCFEKSSYKDENTTDSIDECMSSAGVPNKTLYEQVTIENLSKGEKCVKFGTGSGKEGHAICNLI